MDWNRMTDKEKFIRRLLMVPVLLLIALLALGLIELSKRFIDSPSSETQSYILLGSIVVAAIIVLFVYAKTTDNWEKIKKKMKKHPGRKDKAEG